MQEVTEVLQAVTTYPEVFAVSVVCVAVLVRAAVDAVGDFCRALIEERD